MKRVLLVTIAVVGVAVGVALFLLLRNLDALVEAAIERYGSQLTGTPVRVDSVEIALREGRATVRGFRVGNPEGFAAPNAFTWDEVTVDLEPESVGSPPYVLNAVVIAAPEVVFELNARGEANLRVLQRRLEGAGSRGAGGGSSAGGAEEPRLRVESFRFERGALEVRTAAVGGQDVRVEMPPLRLEDVGGPDGARAGEVGREVLTAYILESLRTAGRRELGGRAEELIDQQLEGEQADAAKKLLNRMLVR